MFKLLILFLLLSNSLFGFQNPAKLGHKYSILEIKEVVKYISTETGEETFVAFTDRQPYIVESLNELATVKIASFLKTKKNTKQKVVLHFYYFTLGDDTTYQYGFKICNVFVDSKKTE